MSQAKTLTQQEVKQVLGIIALDKHAKRNRTMFLLTCWGGLRVGEMERDCCGGKTPVAFQCGLSFLIEDLQNLAGF